MAETIANAVGSGQYKTMMGVAWMADFCSNASGMMA